MGKLPANRATEAYHTEMKRILNNAPKRNPPSSSPDKAEAKTVDQSKPEMPGSQSDRFIAKARELGLDEREETFDAALKKVARRRSSIVDKEHEK